MTIACRQGPSFCPLSISAVDAFLKFKSLLLMKPGRRGLYATPALAAGWPHLRWLSRQSLSNHWVRVMVTPHKLLQGLCVIDICVLSFCVAGIGRMHTMSPCRSHSLASALQTKDQCSIRALQTNAMSQNAILTAHEEPKSPWRKAHVGSPGCVKVFARHECPPLLPCTSSPCSQNQC